jgi:plasmid stabilization system protein ParE
MTRFRFSPEASADLFEIWNFIAQDNPEAADRVETAIYDTCAFVAQTPLVGKIRKDLTSLPVRFWVVPSYPNYTVVYEPVELPVRIIRILHGKRNMKRIFAEPLR